MNGNLEKTRPRVVKRENAEHMPFMYRLAAHVCLDMGLTVLADEDVPASKVDRSVCPSCGAQLAMGAKFCSECGTKTN